MTSSSLHYWQFNYNGRDGYNDDRRLLQYPPKFKFNSILSKLKLLDYSNDFSSIFDISKIKIPEKVIIGKYDHN